MPEGTPSPRREGARSSTRQHSHGASLMEGLPRVIDLVPRRFLSFFLLFAAGVLGIAALEGLYWWMPKVASLTTDGTIETLDLDAEGSLAVWFSSFLLTIAGFTALLIFSVRRRQVDDYSARYRVWLWAAGCWFLLSLDETASLHEGFNGLMTFLTGTRLYGDGSLWWMIAYGLLLGQVGLVLWLEMKTCLASRMAMVGTAICFAVAIAAQLDVALPWLGVRGGIMLEEGAEMLGDLLLLLGMGLHARHVILALGPRREGAVRKKKTASSETGEKAEKEKDKEKEKEVAEPKEKAKPRPAPQAKPKLDAPAKARPEAPAAKPLAAESFKPNVSGGSAASTPAKAPLIPPSIAISPSKPEAPKPQVRVDEAEDLGGNHRKLTKAERKAMKRDKQRFDEGDE